MQQMLLADLSHSILSAYTKLLSTIKIQNPHDFKTRKYDGAVGPVSIAELLSYQIGWGSLLIYWYETGLHQETFPMPGQGFTSWSYVDIADHFYKKYDSYSLEKLLQAFKKIVVTIITFTEKEYAAGRLEKVGV